jgi:hypothetical protein
MHSRLTIEFRRDRLLSQVFAFDHTAQYCLHDCVAAFVWRDIRQAKLVVDLLLRHVIRSDMRNDLPDDGLRILLFATAGKGGGSRKQACGRGHGPATA